MKSSDSIGLIAPAIVKAAADLGPVVKDATNPAFRNKYATLDAIMEQVRPVLAAHGLAVMQGVLHPETDGGRVVGIAVETRLLHLSGEWLASVVVVPVEKPTAQGAGSAISYGRRYGLSAMLGLTAEDDDGNGASTSKRPETSAAAPKRVEREPAPGQRLHDRVPTTPAAAMSLAKAETVELKGKRLVDMEPERLFAVRAWAVEKSNNFILAACDAIAAGRAADGGDDDGAFDDDRVPF
jgi:hypothetical protein